jgi:molybdopterin synthase sulfur carrier subunit
MVTVEFLGPIGKPTLFIEAKNLSELSDILKQDNDIAPWLGICAVAINDMMVSDKNASLKDGDKITLLPPVCGG